MGLTSSVSRFPQPPGKYNVGCADIMVEGVDVDPCGSEDFDKYSGIFARIFYPREDQEVTTMEWLPRREYIEAWSHLTKLPQLMFRHLHRSLIGPLPIPLKWHGQLALAPNGVDLKFPVIVFSHGMLAMRGSYSAICSALASHGFVVAVLEHRDRSSLWTYRVLEDGTEKPIFFQPRRKREQHKSDFDFRLTQITKRAAECKAAMELLTRLNNGELDDLNVQFGADFDWTQFKSRLNCNEAAIMGHSFGGGTAIVTAAKYGRSFKSMIVLDAWMKPVHRDCYDQVVLPSLFLNSNSWNWAVSDQMNIVNNCCTGVEKMAYLVRDSNHQNFCDVAYFINGSMGRTLRTTGGIDPWLCGQITNQLMMAFLTKHLDISDGNDVVFSQVVTQHNNRIELQGANSCIDE